MQWARKIFLWHTPHVHSYLGHAKRKLVYGHMRTATAQIKLHTRAVWSGPSLSANSITGYYRMYQWRPKTPNETLRMLRMFQSAPFAHVRRHVFAWRGPSYEFAVIIQNVGTIKCRNTRKRTFYVCPEFAQSDQNLSLDAFWVAKDEKLFNKDAKFLHSDNEETIL